jgi:hypothetical protein
MPEPDDDNAGVNDPVDPAPSAGGEENQPAADPTAAKGAEGDPASAEPADPAAEPKKTRNEVKHERYIDKLGQELRLSNEASGRYDDNLFSSQPYQPLPLKDGAEYDPKQLEEDRTKVAESNRADGFQQGQRQATTRATLENFETKLDIDKERVAVKWDALDPDKESYRPKLEQYLVQQYIAFTGMEKDAQGRITIQRPNIRFRDFVDAEMQNMEDYATDRGAQSTQNVQRQAANTGIRPNGQAPAPKKGHGFDSNDPAGSVARMTSEQYHKLGGKEASDAYLAERGLGPKV